MMERIEEMRLSAEYERQIAEMLVRAFQEDFGGRSYHKQRHHLRLVWREDGQIVGHMALCFRDIRLGEALVPIVGLAEVSTDPAYRGRGIASGLMRAAVDEARATLANFFVLFGDRPLYAASGFVPHRNRLTYVGMDHAHTGAVDTKVDDGLMVLPLTDMAWEPRAEVDLLGHLF
ncbi:GNAT family N-acetyltransferase [Flavimaricola marinus]|uniref:Acetyltransferase (GNAT) family protein n=1 Tax=Flavimaricola marinus TaxID=1819565 RepID=A0A238LFR2_9RHOB|nr:GNAT family N-acetyltransferase [Flavimaricola marinus]SMY08255.1 Acetyltransferase (GNAT) family protein [Flavimaricola marinus]